MNCIQNFVKNIKDRPEYIGILGIVITILGTILPAIYIANVPMSYIEGDGKYIVLSMVIVGILMWKKKAIISLVPTLLSCLLITRYLYVTTSTRVPESYIVGLVKNGPGIYLMIIGLCLCLAYGVFGSNKIKEKEKVKLNLKYYLIGLILPIIGIYIWVIDRNKYKEKSTNALRGALLGLVIFLAISLLYSLNI